MGLSIYFVKFFAFSAPPGEIFNSIFISTGHRQMRSKLILIFILYTLHLNAQEMWGISNSNFAGHMGLFLNPSTIVGAPYQYEINLIAADQFVDNTILYKPVNQKFLSEDYTGKLQQGEKYYVNGKGVQNGFSHTLVIGPSYIHNKTSWAWSLHSAYRSELSTINISPELALMLSENFRTPELYGTTYSTKPFSSTYASWFEAGGTYGKVFREDEHNIFKWAANVNLLIGLSGYAYDNTTLDFTQIDSSQLIVHKMEASYSHTTSESPFAIQGFGLSTTTGITYIKNPNRGAFDCNMSNDRLKKYKYRLGVSLIDLGLIRFISNTQQYSVNTSNDFVWNGTDTLGFPSLNSLDSNLYRNLGGTFEDKNFNIWLPLGISAQFDYQLQANLFANASVVNRIHLNKNQIARGNQINLSIRYERRRYEGALSFSMFEYSQPNVGIGLRYRSFVIGTDRLLQMLNLSDAKSFDIFFGLKFQFCKRPFSPGPDCPAYLSH
jgi:hypothetical protein